MSFFKTTNWAYIMNALSSMLTDEDYMDKFPKFAYEMEKYDFFDLFMKDCFEAALQKNECKKYIMTSFINTILEGRKSFERVDDFIEIIANMLDTFENIEDFPVYLLFEENHDNWDTELFNYEIRAKIIDYITIYDPDFKPIIKEFPKEFDEDFTWKDIPSRSPFEVKDLEMDTLLRYSVLKFYSNYLKM